MSEAMHFSTTERGFAIARFFDRYGEACSLQKSSLATEDCIWLGCHDLNLRRLTDEGWRPVTETGLIGNTRMHLTREMVARLLPVLEHFVKTGDLPPAQESSDAPR